MGPAVLLGALLAPLFTCLAASASAGSLEYAVKATYLLKFTRFVVWPQAALGAGDSFNICILGPDPFGEHDD